MNETNEGGKKNKPQSNQRLFLWMNWFLTGVGFEKKDKPKTKKFKKNVHINAFSIAPPFIITVIL